MKKMICILWISFFIISGVSALELSGGKIKVVLHETNGRFSLYYLDNIAQKKYISLLFDKDPKTTALFVTLGNRIFTMGDTSFFSQKLVINSDTSASFVWTSKIIEITETFTLIKSQKSAFFDGVKISLLVENISESPQNVGMCYLFDTYLGEKNKKHFITSGGMDIRAETYYTSDFPAYFISPTDTSSSFKGLQCMLQGPGITIPDKVIFANWKRLKENIFSYTVHDSRNFNYLPYSINDSAVALYYYQHPLPVQGKRHVVLALGAATGSFFRGIKTGTEASEINKLYAQTVKTPGSAFDRKTAVETDLLAVNNLLKTIDKDLQSPGLLNKEDIALIKQIIDNLTQRKKSYSNR